MTLKIVLTPEQVTRLSRFANEALPNESCAFLFGSSSESTVTEILLMKNVDSSPYSFSIEPSELLDAYDKAGKKGLDVIGIFHSHPGEPSPSTTDLKYMEINPVIWLIYSTTEDRFGAYLSERSVIKCDVIITD
jgi:[CysO sulfur-carrier protein]-S-L-cysteine hydrolase